MFGVRGVVLSGMACNAVLQNRFSISRFFCLAAESFLRDSNGGVNEPMLIDVDREDLR